MRKYAFRKGDVVRARSGVRRQTVDFSELVTKEIITVPEDEETVVGRVIGFGSSAGHDWYKVASGGDVWNCRDDELELIRRGPAGHEFPPIDENELERFLLIWRPMSVDPPKDAECLAVWRRENGALRERVLRWDGELWIMEYNGVKVEFDREFVDAWALWEWPEIDQKPDGEEGVRDDADPDDGQAGD